ncbi:hypothetical protein [Saccharothrix xinjiangensis]|uniref:Uncharacterized protein n=1 Tax=Saccharothrix xinjiangensis TaxID=204798 RepID=A0ABV9Y226_9PSEU
MIGPLRWRRLAAGGPDDQRAFAAEVGRRLGLRDYHPALTCDPISHWIEQDCHQAPSTPNTDYRSLRTFGGSSFVKPAKDNDNKRRLAAYWFARKHRRGGDALLHHRSLGLVIIRDWSPRMELFTAALAQTAATRTHQPRRPRSGPEERALVTATWTRPDPVHSSWLDTATEPLPWHERTGPRPATAARPFLPRERPRTRR